MTAFCRKGWAQRHPSSRARDGRAGRAGGGSSDPRGSLLLHHDVNCVTTRIGRQGPLSSRCRQGSTRRAGNSSHIGRDSVAVKTGCPGGRPPRAPGLARNARAAAALAGWLWRVMWRADRAGGGAHDAWRGPSSLTTESAYPTGRNPSRW
ncbi:hypothetical protein FM117_00915 [Micrococcus luteus Mu201]|nr:hypothetical protein FM117_00915 [Micrococcus luteus Mu201]